MWERIRPPAVYLVRNKLTKKQKPPRPSILHWVPYKSPILHAIWEQSSIEFIFVRSNPLLLEHLQCRSVVGCCISILYSHIIFLLFLLLASATLYITTRLSSARSVSYRGYRKSILWFWHNLFGDLCVRPYGHLFFSVTLSRYYNEWLMISLIDEQIISNST